MFGLRIEDTRATVPPTPGSALEGGHVAGDTHSHATGSQFRLEITTCVHIRPERAEDIPAVRALHLDAFAPSMAEADIVDELREAGDLVAQLCLVAFAGDGALLANVCFSVAQIGPSEVLALAPMAVAPDLQRNGIGTRLLCEALRRARKTSWPAAVVLGHPRYYPRFGFEPAGALGIKCPFDAPADAWMVLRLPAWDDGVQGTVAYAPALAG